MSTTNKPTSILLFTTSQTPLSPRYAHPAKPKLLLPPLVHTSLHNALDSDNPSWTVLKHGLSGIGDGAEGDGGVVVIPNPKDLGPNGSPHGTLSNGLSSSQTHINTLALNNTSSSTSSSNHKPLSPITTTFNQTNKPPTRSSSPSPRSPAPRPPPTAEDDFKERQDNEITVKFYLVGSPKSHRSRGETTDDEEGSSDTDAVVAEQVGWIQEGMEMLEKYKRPKWAFGNKFQGEGGDGNGDRNGTNGVEGMTEKDQGGRIDTFLIGWKGIDYIGKKNPDQDETDAEAEDGKVEGGKSQKVGGCGSAKLASKMEAEREREELSGGISVSEGKKKEMIGLWKALDTLLPNAIQLGALSLPLPLLQLLHSSSAPSPSSASPSSPNSSTKAPSHSASTLVSNPRAKKQAQAQAQGGDEVNTMSSMSSSDPVTEMDEGEGGERERKISTNSTGSATKEDKALLEEMLASATSPPITVGGADTAGSASKQDGVAVASPSSAATSPSTPASTHRQLKVNSLNTPDCHSLPEGLLKWAKEEGVELWAGGSGIGSDPMPSIHLHNTLAEFVPQFPADLLPEGSNLGKIVAFPSSETGSSGTEGEVKLGVDVRWVMSYTVISRTRNVVKDKGYIISAALI